MYERFDEGGKVICQVCGKSFGFITVPHVKTHNMTYVEYREKFKDFPLKSLPWQANLQKSNKIDLFKKVIEENEKIENIKPIIKPKKIKIENLPKPKTIKSEFSGKRKILNILKKSYPDLTPDYFIRKKLNNGVLEYNFVTDIADPVKKIDFEFLDTFWHNKDNVFNVNRNSILKKDGWRVLIFKGVSPKLKDIEKKLDIISDDL